MTHVIDKFARIVREIERRKLAAFFFAGDTGFAWLVIHFSSSTSALFGIVRIDDKSGDLCFVLSFLVNKSVTTMKDRERLGVLVKFDEVSTGNWMLLCISRDSPRFVRSCSLFLYFYTFFACILLFRYSFPSVHRRPSNEVNPRPKSPFDFPYMRHRVLRFPVPRCFRKNAIFVSLAFDYHRAWIIKRGSAGMKFPSNESIL